MKSQRLVLTLSLALMMNFVPFSSQAFETDNSGESPEYLRTKILCEAQGLQFYSQIGSLWLAAFQEEGLIPTITDLYNSHSFRQLSISSTLDKLSNSPEYFKAVKECFGSDPTREQIFFFGLLAADISGKFSAWILDVTLIRSLYYAVRAFYVANLGHSAKNLMWFRTIFNMATKDRSLLEKIYNPLFMSTLIGSIVGQKYLDVQIEEQIVLSKAEQDDPSIKLLADEVNKYDRALTRATPQEAIVLKTLKLMAQNDLRRMQGKYEALKRE